MQITENEIVAAVRQEYGIGAVISPLPGELDLNYLVSIGAERFVLKLMRKDCDPAFVDMQIKAMDHIRRAECEVAIPEITETNSGSKHFWLGDRLGWLIGFLPGQIMAETSPWSLGLAHSIGENTASLCRALHDFDHPQLDRPLKWNLRESLWVKNHSTVFKDRKRSEMIAEIVAQFEHDVLPRLNQLNDVPIYNDANDMNILVNVRENGAQYVSGIIDFGDITRAPRVCEPAIAMAYTMMRDSNPIKRGSALITGFHNVLQLTELEIDLLLPMTKMRLACTVTNAAVESQIHPENQYLSVSEAPAWDLLEILLGLNERDIKETFRRACNESEQ